MSDVSPHTPIPAARKIIDAEALSVSCFCPEFHNSSLKISSLQDSGAKVIDNSTAVEDQDGRMDMVTISSALLQHGGEHTESPSPSPRSRDRTRSLASPEAPDSVDIDLDKSPILVLRSPRIDPTSAFSNTSLRSDDDDIALVTGELPLHNGSDALSINAMRGPSDDIDTEMHHGHEYTSDQEAPTNSQHLSKVVIGRSAPKRPRSSPECSCKSSKVTGTV